MAKSKKGMHSQKAAAAYLFKVNKNKGRSFFVSGFTVFLPEIRN